MLFTGVVYCYEYQQLWVIPLFAKLASGVEDRVKKLLKYDGGARLKCSTHDQFRFLYIKR